MAFTFFVICRFDTLYFRFLIMSFPNMRCLGHILGLASIIDKDAILLEIFAIVLMQCCHGHRVHGAANPVSQRISCCHGHAESSRVANVQPPVSKRPNQNRRLEELHTRS